MTGETIGYGIRWNIKRYDEESTAWLTKRMARANLFGKQDAAPQGRDFVNHGIKPYEESEVVGNLLTNEGLSRITSLITGAGGQAASFTATRLGVGNGVGSASVFDTDLSAAAGSTNRYFHVLDSGYPFVNVGQMVFQATFDGTEANFTWNEFGIDIDSPTVVSGSTVNAVLLNHKTSIAQGTKTSGQSWIATATLTLS